MVALLNLPSRDLQATSWSSYLVVIQRVLLRILSWFKKTMNKEYRYSHLVPMDPLLCKLSPYLRHTMQIIVIKDGKNNCIV
jgi:hypothetical protein